MITPASLRQYLTQLGLEPEIASIYTALYGQPAQTISALARRSGVERTHIYRLIDKLTRSNLVEVELSAKRTLFRAAPVENLRLLLHQKEDELRNLQTQLAIIEQSASPHSLVSPATRVQYYQGPEGVKQMFWNQTRHPTHIMAILNRNMQSLTQAAFFERWVERCNDRGIRSRGLINDGFLASQQTWYAEHPHHSRLRHWEARHLPDSLLPVEHGTLIYGQVVAYFNWRDEEVFGMEIYNPEIAHAQQRLFEILWQQCPPVDDRAAPA